MSSKRTNRRRFLSLCFVLIMLIGTAGAEGLFPSMNQLFGTAMPSVGVALGRTADETVDTERGKEETYRGFSYDDYTAFGAYLAGTSAKLDNTEVTGSAIIVALSARGASMQFIYDWSSRTATAVYPSGTRPETEKAAVVAKAGILPPVGGIMPSAQFAVGRRPDSESADENGVTQVWANFTDADYSAFSTYLARTGATLKQSSAVGGVLTAEISLNASSFTFTYNWHTKTATALYPVGTSPEREKRNTFQGNGSILPKMDTIGKSMPSLGEALGRYPDDEPEHTDSGSTEVFRNVTETDFNTFSVYLSDKGATLADYRAEGTTFSASIQVEGKTISFTYDTQTLEARVTYPQGTYDEWLDYAKTQYASAVQLMDAGKTDEAASVLFTIPNYSGYGPAAEYLEAHPVLAAAAAAREAKLASFRTVGCYVTFGSYEQDDNTGNGREPIEWLVLDYDAANNRALLLSRYGLDTKPYNTDDVDITWEKCTLRTWLNGEFMNQAFSKTEQSAILATAVDNSKSQCYSGYSTNGGNNTQDKVFLLSYSEANKYLGVTPGNYNNTKSRVAPTAYAVKQGAFTIRDFKTADGTAVGVWWLRSPGYYDQRCAAVVYRDGSLSYGSVYGENVCVCPALWINLESDIF